jgi:cell fate regulator YaaT (PSP1 superfamily)
VLNTIYKGKNMQEFVEVEFRSGRLGYVLNPNDFELSPEQKVIVEVERGFDIADVVYCRIQSKELEEALENSQKFFNIVKVADDEDLKKLETVIENEQKATDSFQEMVVKYPFEMKLVGTVYQFDGNKLTFFFTADGRVDFREFVRELASVFRTRIELHQTTGRDEAKRLGGFGMCGYKYCCASYLRHFNQVTIKMAKDQNLSGNLSKISGPCGRLLCCLHYEEDFYVETAKEFPDIGETIFYNKVKMYVYKNDFYNKKVHLTNDDQDLEVLSLDEYHRCKRPRRCNKHKNGKHCHGSHESS